MGIFFNKITFAAQKGITFAGRSKYLADKVKRK